MITMLYIRYNLQSLVLDTGYHNRYSAFRIAQGCTSGTSTVAFASSWTAAMLDFAKIAAPLG